MTIAESVKKIKKWTKVNAVPLYKRIAGPAPKPQLAKVEKLAKKCGIDMPESYLEWLRIMNGQVDDFKDTSVGLIPASVKPYILYGTAMLLNDMSVGFDLSSDKGRFDCDPEIQPIYFDKQWVQFASGCNSALAIDQNPTKQGRLGQVIVIDYASPRRRVVCKSFEEFLAKLAERYECDKYVFVDGLLRKRRKNAFPNLDFTASAKTAVNKKRSKSKKARFKANIEIKGRVRVVNETDSSVDVETSPKVLKRFDGKSSFESVVTYFNSNKHEIAVQNKIVAGGEIELEFDKKTKNLWVVTRYKTKVPLTAKELTLLKKHTLGQWSDGLGAGFADEMFEEFGLTVELFPVLAGYDPSKPLVVQGKN